MDPPCFRGSSAGAQSSVSDIQIFQLPLQKIYQTHSLFFWTFPTSDFSIPSHLPITKVMPPVNRLPIENLGKIFMQFLPDAIPFWGLF